MDSWNCILFMSSWQIPMSKIFYWPHHLKSTTKLMELSRPPGFIPQDLYPSPQSMISPLNGPFAEQMGWSERHYLNYWACKWALPFVKEWKKYICDIEIGAKKTFHEQELKGLFLCIPFCIGVFKISFKNCFILGEP